jgi:predicted DNA binding CopG/RHH family protein
MMKAKKSEINFKEYEAVDVLDKEETELFKKLQKGEYQSVMTDKLKAHYVDIFTKNSKREHASTVRLTFNDKILAKMKAKEEGMPYQVLLASIIHKWLHGRFVEL